MPTLNYRCLISAQEFSITTSSYPHASRSEELDSPGLLALPSKTKHDLMRVFTGIAGLGDRSHGPPRNCKRLSHAHRTQIFRTRHARRSSRYGCVRLEQLSTHGVSIVLKLQHMMVQSPKVPHKVPSIITTDLQHPRTMFSCRLEMNTRAG